MVVRFVPLLSMACAMVLALEPGLRSYDGPHEAAPGSEPALPKPSLESSQPSDLPATEPEPPQPEAFPGAKARVRSRGGTTVLLPPKRRKHKPEPADRSQSGRYRGGLEFALASATTTLTGVLIGRGIWELTGASTSCPANITTCDTPSQGALIAGGLSLGLAVPVAIASGFLFARGAKIHRDYRKWKSATARTHPTITGGLAAGGSGRSRQLAVRLGLRWRF